MDKPLDQYYKHKQTKDGLRGSCKICQSKAQKERRDKNRDAINAWNREYYRKRMATEEGRKRMRKKWNRNTSERHRKRSKSDPEYVMKRRLRCRIRNALNGRSKSASTAELTGCTWDFLMKHIESQFFDGMSWENRSEWHVDHIRPCASFDLLDESEQRKCFHYSNLQPLWAFDNISKGAKYSI